MPQKDRTESNFVEIRSLLKTTQQILKAFPVLADVIFSRWKALRYFRWDNPVENCFDYQRPN